MTVEQTRSAGLRAYHALALLPMLGLLGGVWFANRTEPYVLGLPFLLFWIVMWVVGASVIMWIIWTLDRARGVGATLEDPADSPAGGAR